MKAKNIFAVMLCGALLVGFSACEKEESVSIDSLLTQIEIKMVDGHNAVDLELPSGTLWATCNIGAETPADYGTYFAWGEIESKSIYNRDNYKFLNDKYLFTKYCNDTIHGIKDDKSVLDSIDDVACMTWGGAWRTPTKADFEELFNFCKDSFVLDEGVYFYIMDTIENIPFKKYVFLPAAGYSYENGPNLAGVDGGYLTSSLSSTFPERAYCFRLNLGTGLFEGSRFYGQTVRAVWKK